MTDFYVLEDVCFNEFVSHVSFTPYGCLVSCNADMVFSLLFTYDEALVFCNFLKEHDPDCYGYNIVPFTV